MFISFKYCISNAFAFVNFLYKIFYKFKSANLILFYSNYYNISINYLNKLII